ncbi:hypothetical protein [Geothrix sp. 21YS21S-2]|uniref:hypothetical protein n=1 Tax=Geothrix sp. 21YS21S-2 TaxID=3068893 RepID=UPI0027BA0FD5|nr:hypothetical protein [Geothrix sp. 21YS21S-2]
MPEGSQGCTWWVVRRDGDGPRNLLQLWEPLPGPKGLDSIKAGFLERFSLGEPADPPVCHLGFDDKAAWFLQGLDGVPFLRLWGDEDEAGRESLVQTVREAMGRSRFPRLLAPEVIGVKPGRILVPRVLGTAPWGHDGLVALPDVPARRVGNPRIWEQPPELVEASGCPIRGRSQELTYTKSLMFGLGSSVPMERVLLLQGEEGLGQDRLCDWTAAAAESEGIWVCTTELLPGERAGGFLGRLLQEAIAGLEADLYAAEPALAKALSRRLATFAFLRGGRRPGFAERKLDVEEVEAAVGALDYAHANHPRLIQVRGLELVTPEILDLLRGLVGHSRMPWLLSFRGAGSCQGLKSYLESMRNQDTAATVFLDRLEDARLPEILGDLLGPHALPAAFVAEACQACLGNPGLLQGILEMAILQGRLVWAGGCWTCPGGEAPALDTQEGRKQAILAGRLERLGPEALAAVRTLALADAPLDQATLVRALGLDADTAEEPLGTLVGARLALLAEGRYRIPGPQVRDLVLGHAGDLPRLARALLRAMEEEGRRPVLAVRLQACAQDRGTALAQVLAAVERELPGPLEAQEVVNEALDLGPDPREQARLWEFLSDAWTLGPGGEHVAWESAGERSPYELAWEALDRAIRALGEPGPGADEEEQAARLHRKKAFLEIRLRRFRDAHQSIRMAAACLADHPFHAEQPRLRLALGRLHVAQGAGTKAVRAMEEGLSLLAQKGAGAGHKDHVALLLELGRVQGHRAQFQHAVASLGAGKRFLEHEGDHRRLAGVAEALGQAHLGLGQMEAAWQYFNDALGLARSLDDAGLKAACHLDLGMLRSCQQLLGPSLAHIDSALRRYQAMGDRPLAARALAWKARTLAALGDFVQAEFLLVKASEGPLEAATALELGEAVFLGGEIAAFRESWRDARRLYLEAANRLGEAGYVWRERLSRLRYIQAETLEAGPLAPESAWVHLERLKGPVEGTGSRWLELEWHRAHALLLSRSGTGEAVISEALLAWGEVVALARELKFHAQVLEAETRSSELLLARGERLGARSRIQDALPSLQELWSRLPSPYEESFLARPDLHAFRQAVEATGMRFTLPPRSDHLADWSPTQANLPPVPNPRVNP